MVFRQIAIGCAGFALSLCACFAADPAVPSVKVVVTPGVERDPGLPAPGVWPSFSASVGTKEVRHCMTWRMGWEAFVYDRAMPAMEAFGRVWIHNPGGMIFGKPMPYQQFSDCTNTAKLTGNEILQRVSRWDVFTREMSRLSSAGDLVIYIGCPVTMLIQAGETDAEWLARAVEEIRPVTEIRPRVAIGLDATYGQPFDDQQHKHLQWDRFGGEEGLLAKLVVKLLDDGHEVLFEPGVLASANWATSRVGLISNHRFWNGQLKGKDVRTRHYLPGWGDHLKPTEVTQRQFRYLQLMTKRTREEELALIDAIVAAGYDCIVPWEKHPEWSRVVRPSLSE